MRALARLGFAAGVAVAFTVAFAGSASAAPAPGQDGGARVVFVQTDNTAGNQVVAYDRSGNGSLSPAHAYYTGGDGAVLAGSVVDLLASQGSLTFDAAHDLLYAVNAGSNTVSVFSVRGDDLALRQVVGSGGTFPVSVAVSGDLVYVLNALDGGSIQGYVASFGHLHLVRAWNRPLGLDPTETPQYTSTPGQVLFSPDGSQLLVTTKNNGNAIDVFHIAPFGRPSNDAVVNVEAGAVPFAATFVDDHHLLVTEAGPSDVASFTLHGDGTLTPGTSVGSTQAATCWIIPGSDGILYTSNAGSASLSTIELTGHGQLALAGQTTTDAGTVDASVSSDGRFLYAQTGGTGTVDEFRIHVDGSLSPIGSVLVPGAVGGEGIVAL
jgi:6-phosphogluconolactonase (cycloisomerase 2 family)